MSQPSLHELQRWMKSRVSSVGAGLVPAQGRPQEPPLLNPQGGEPGEDRLSVYAGGYVARTFDALKEVYEAVRHVIGENNFHNLSDAYAEKYPSQDYNLSFFGRHLPEFLKSNPLTQEYSFLPDVARLEWQVCLAFHSFEKPPLDPGKLAKLAPEDWENLRLDFQPSVSVLASAWPVLDIWNARETPIKEIHIPLINRPQNMLIYRVGYSVQGELLTGLELKILEGLLAGKTLGALLESLAAEIEADPNVISNCFSRWMSLGLIV